MHVQERRNGCVDVKDNLLERVRLFNDPARLITYLHDCASSSVTYILLPSASIYTLPFTLHIPQQLQNMRVVGQTDRTGKPYCRACIIGVDPSEVVDVDLLAEHEAPDYAPSGSAFDKRLHPLLWLIIAALWSDEKLVQLLAYLGNRVQLVRMLALALLSSCL